MDHQKRLAKILDKTLKTTAKVDSEGNTLVNTYQDVEPVMEYCANLRRADHEDRGSFGKRGELHRTMSVPMNIIMQICNDHGLDFFNPEHSKAILRILKGPDYAAFRTSIDKAI